MDRKNIPEQAPSIPETPQQTPKDPSSSLSPHIQEQHERLLTMAKPPDIREDIADYADRALELIQKQRKRGTLNQDFFLAFIQLFPSRLTDLQVTERTIRKLVSNRHDAKTTDSRLKTSAIIQRFNPYSMFWHYNDFERIEQELSVYRTEKKQLRRWLETTAMLFRLFALPVDPGHIPAWKTWMEQSNAVHTGNQDVLLRIQETIKTDADTQRTIQQTLAHRKQTDATWLQSPEVLHTLANIHTIYPHMPEARMPAEEYMTLKNTIVTQLGKRSAESFIQHLLMARDLYFCTL
jgi:hypothetical protein